MSAINVDLLEWLGSIAGIVGAWMMAGNTRVSPWAYPIWICASLSMLIFALQGGHFGLALQQAAFSVINLIGLWRWVIYPPPVVGSSIESST